MPNELHVIVFGGPNGSGKTSLIDEVRVTGLKTLKGVYPVPETFINPDQVAKDLPGSFQNQTERDQAAFYAAVNLREETINSKKSFAFETVMSHPSRINEMLRLKQQGYLLLLTFVTTDDPEKNVERVKFRFETGTTTGHFVPPETVRDRYQRTLALLPKAVEVADAVFIYDNSTDFKKASLQAYIEGTIFDVVEDAKDWVKSRLITPLQARESAYNEITLYVEERGHEVAPTDELGGVYSGALICVTDHYIAQVCEDANQLVIHDRLMLDVMAPPEAPPTYRLDEVITVQYSQKNAPEIKRHADPKIASIS